MAGPPVEVQVRVNTGGSVAGSVFNWKVISPGIVTWPVEGTNIILSVAIVILKKIEDFDCHPSSRTVFIQIYSLTEQHTAGLLICYGI